MVRFQIVLTQPSDQEKAPSWLVGFLSHPKEPKYCSAETPTIQHPNLSILLKYLILQELWERKHGMGWAELEQTVICWKLPCAGILVKMPQIGWLINNRNLLLAVLGAASPRSRHQHGRVNALFLVQGLHLLAVSSHGGRDQGSLWNLFF